MKRLIPLLLLLTLLLTACGAGTASTAATPEPTAEALENASEEQDTGDNPIVTLSIKDLGDITIELYPDVAPNTVANFVNLVESGYYDGLIFHRVISGFMIQGGDPTGTGMGGPGYAIKGEFSQNGFENDLKHTRGVISMARSQAMDSAGSQFFIMHADAAYLDGAYAAFGRVTDGMDVVDAIASVKTDASDRPLTDVVIEKATVETFGKTYTVEKIQ